MKTVFALLLLALVTACSHPLEIVGQGDIISSTGKNDCLLENQPCPNVVANDYIVTYKAVPRAGSYFVGWKNCGDQFPDCPVSVSADVVNQFWFQTMPPLIAVFARTGLTNLNDTGITFGGNYPQNSNNAGCTGVTIAQQDCAHGRDVAHNDDSDGHAGFSYTKLSSNGTVLPASATNWACVRDNVTGLVWEMKTTDGGIHDRNRTFRWGGKTAQGSGYGTYYPDWNVLVDGSNNEALCGFTDWRVPTQHELQSIVNYNRFKPAIDMAWFPNTYWIPVTSTLYFWSASPSATHSSDARGVFSYDGGSTILSRVDYYRVRLVRAGQ